MYSQLICLGDFMFVELIYDKRNMAGSTLQNFLAKIPEEWCLEQPEDNDDFIAFIEDTLEQANSDDFWSKIT